ncbi:LuxR C-terminal-related transcriptional regulator [Nocardioides sp. SYSU DS0663]|uniref:helix-turn-helix transcriptional regulator n=1 Tax=Nocardioides sp. SYSU DS0663 TaxID=3416445 RepID=UPI003F4BD6D3
MARAPLTVGVVSPHELVLTGLTAMLGRHPGRVVLRGPAPGDGQLRGLDVVVYDAAGLGPAHDPSGAALERLVRANTRVVALARPHDPALTSSALDRGAAGVLRMDAPAEEMLDLLDRVMRSGARGAASNRHVDARLLDLPRGLTVREFEVLGLVASGLSNGEIADRLFVSVNTVKTYVRAAYRKIGVERRSQAVIWCAQHGVTTS